MKRISADSKIRFMDLARHRFAHEIARKGRAYDPGRRVSPVRAAANHKARQFIDIVVPEFLCLDKAYEETAIFLQAVRESVLTTMVTIRLRFEDCKNIKPTAMLMLLSEVHRARLLRGQHALTGTYPKDHALLRRMCAMGFFKLLGIRSPLETPKTFPLEYIPFQSSNKRAKHTTREMREGLLGENIKMQTLARRQLQRGVAEAMLNAITHAYPEDAIKHPAVRNRWWICGHYHPPSKKVWIMFCDLGVGIPRTLPRRYPLERIRGVLNMLPGMAPDDGEMVYAAMQLGRSSTEQLHRGKGLKDLLFFIDQAGAGDLQIFSNRGYYQYRGDGTEHKATLPASIGGTLIKWSVPLDKVVISEEDHGSEDKIDQDSK